jgi:hypothetical protein
MNQRTQIVAVAAFAIVLIGLFALLSPRNTQRVQAGFLGMIAPMLKQGSSLDRRINAFREGLKSLSSWRTRTSA